MNKTLFIKSFGVILLVVLSFSVYSLNCATITEKPHGFHGYAKYGSSVLAGKTVTATLGGNEFSTTTTSDGYYGFNVERCSGSSDTTITFTVCTRSATATTTTYSEETETEQNLTISSDCPAAVAAAGGGGGGGGGAAAGGGGGAAVPSEVNLNIKADFARTGTTLRQTQGDKAKFTVGGVQYTAELTKLTSDSITITVAGQSTVLKIGDSAEFDVNGDGVNDISVKLIKIEGGRAEILYKLLAKAEEKPAEEVPAEEKKEEVKPPAEIIPPPSKAWIGWLVVGVVVVIGLVVYLVVAKKKKPGFLV